MKLVTPFKKSIKMPPEYVPGKCNIGARGRAIRLTTGLGILAVFIAFDLLALRSVSSIFRLFLFIPLYIGLLTAWKEQCRSACFTPPGALTTFTSLAVWPLAGPRPKLR